MFIQQADFKFMRLIMLLLFVGFVSTGTYAQQGMDTSQTAWNNFTFLYYFESDDVLVDSGERPLYAFTPLPREAVTIVLYSMDGETPPHLRLFDPSGNLIAQDSPSNGAPVAVINYQVSQIGLYRFDIGHMGTDEALLRVMLFEGEPLATDLTFLDDLNPLLYGRAFMVAGGTLDNPLRTLVDVLPIPRVNESPRIFASRGTFDELPPDEERFNAVDYFVWFNDDNQAIYTVNIRPLPEPNAPQERISNFVSFNGANFFYFDYYFTVGAGSDPVQLIRGDECVLFPDRADCVIASPTFGRTAPSPREQLEPPEEPRAPIFGELVIIFDEDDPAPTCVFINGYCIPIAVYNAAVNILIGKDDPLDPDVDATLVPGTPFSNFCGGTPFNDIIFCFAGDDVFSVGGGDNWVFAGAGNDTIYGGPGNDVIFGELGNNIIFGGSGNDTLHGGTGNDQLFGEAGNDTLYTGGGVNLLVGGEGDDTLIVNASQATSLPCNDALLPLDADGNFLFNNGSTILDGGTGNNIYRIEVGVTGCIDIDPYDDTDQFDFLDLRAFTPITHGVPIIIDLNLSTFQEIANDLFLRFGSHFQGVIGGHVPNEITGNDADNVIIGGARNDTLIGGGGNDTLDGFGGVNILDGGTGNNTVTYTSASGGAIVSLIAGTGTSPGRSDTLINIRNITGGRFNDTLIGDDEDNIIDGGGGNDFLYGMAGDDIFIISPGIDYIDGGVGNDTIDFRRVWMGVTVYLAMQNTTVTNYFMPLTYDGYYTINSTNYGALVSIENIIGSPYDDFLVGDNNANIIDGHAGSNTIFARGGDDIIIGNPGDDYIDGGAGYDILDYSGALNPVLVQMSGSATSIDFGTDTFLNIEEIITGAGNDTFIFALSQSIDGNLDGGGGTNMVDYTAYGSAVLVDIGTNTATGIGGHFFNMHHFIGRLGNSDTFVGGDGGNAWMLNADDAGSVNGVTFASFENLTAGDGGDTFTLNINVTLSGDLTGGAGDDNFILNVDSSIGGELDGGGGTNTLDYSARGDAIVVNLGAGTATAIGGFISNINAFVGGTGNNDAFIGGDGGNVWTLSANDAGSVNGVTFASFENLTAGDGGDTFTLDANVTLSGDLTGGAGDDNFILNAGSSIGGDLNGGGGANTLDYSARGDAIVVDLEAGTATAIGGFISNISAFVGGTSNNDAFIGGDGGNAWTLSADDAGSVNGVPFASFENLTAGDGGDTFTLNANVTLSGDLTGGAGDDSFILNADSSIGGDLNGGGGANTLDYSARGDTIVVNLRAGTATAIGGFISNISAFVGGTSNNDAFIGGDGGNAWTLSAGDAGSVNGVTFASFENLTAGDGGDTFTLNANVTLSGDLTGGAGDDSFILNADSSIGGDLDGGGGANTLDYSARGDTIVVNLRAGTATAIGGFISNISAFVSGTGSDTLVGGDGGNVWTLSADDAGSVNGVTFTSFENLTAGEGGDTFTLDTNVTLSGDLTGGAGDDSFILNEDSSIGGDLDGTGGTNTLDYSNRSTDVSVDLSNNSATDVIGQVDNVQNVTTGSGDDVVMGDGGDNIISTGDGDDTIYGSAGTDILDGGAGDDTYIFGDGVNDTTVNDSDGDDTFDFSPTTYDLTFEFSDTTTTIVDTATDGTQTNVTTASQIETFIGGQARNTFRFIGVLTGLYILDNQEDDIIDFGDLTMTSGVQFDMSITAVQTVATEGADTLQIQLSQVIRNFIGTSFGDEVTADDGDNSIITGDGDDIITVTGDGANTIETNGGNNTIQVGDGNNDITTGAGDDEIIAGDGANTIETSGGNNMIQVGDGNNDITTGAGDDEIIAGDGANTIETSGGNNTIQVGDGNNDITTGAGDDEIIAGDGANTIETNDGNNMIQVGDGGNDIMIEGDGNNTVYGGAGDDTITIEGDGDNTVYGGAGDDTITIEGDGDNTVYGGADNSGGGHGDDGGDVITITGAGDNVVYGGNNNCDGGSGDDGDDVITITGAGDNVVYGGNNNCDGGSGNDGDDTITIDGTGDNTVYGGNKNSDGGSGDDGSDTINIETNPGGNNVVYGGNNNSNLGTGNDGSDTITVKTGGSNIVYGGNNNTDGGQGDDVADTIDVADGEDNDTVYGGNDNTAGGSGATAPPPPGPDADDITADPGDTVIYGNND